MRVIVGILLAGSLVGAYGQSTKPPGRIVTTTRLVAIFSELENDCMKAVQENDENTLNKLLSDDFEVWTPAPPGHPIPREDWLKQVQKPQSFRIRQMAVRGVADDISIASFVLSETINQTGAKPRNTFIVDVWTKIADQWQLMDRYASPIVGATPAATQVDKQPTGKR
jgi:ketosteroid isomerase-like protein